MIHFSKQTRGWLAAVFVAWASGAIAGLLGLLYTSIAALVCYIAFRGAE